MSETEIHEQNINEAGDVSLAELLREMRELRDDNAKLQERLTRIESRITKLPEQLKNSSASPASEAHYETIDQFITDQIQQNLDKEADEEELEDPPDEEVEVNWEYFVAQKGGFDEVLYMTVQDFLGLREKEPDRLVKFLLEKRDQEVEGSFQHLRTEYENLEGNQLQDHFTKLWELHHNLLKKKIIRSWKEEIFLAAFDRFISWLQH